MTEHCTELDAAIAEAGLVPGQSPSPAILPDPMRLFSRRADRLRHLAPGHSLSGWLSFAALLCDAQARLVQDGVDGGDALPDAAWTRILVPLLARIDGDLPAEAKAIIHLLQTADQADLNARFDRLQAGRATPQDLAAAPFLTAARQVAWTNHAARQDLARITPDAIAHQCPVCGQPPVAGTVNVGGTTGGLRYLHCGQCGTAWHHVRATCTACGDSEKVSYQSIEGNDDGVSAECCDSCQSSLKLFWLEKDPQREPVADDLASLHLDILVGEDGYRRIAGNPFLAMGPDL